MDDIMNTHYSFPSTHGEPIFGYPSARRRNINRRRPTHERMGPDVLRGAREIALFLYDDASQTRRVYYLIQEGHLPVFRFGGRLHARRSVLIDFVEAQEDAAVTDAGEGRA